ncbi:hypothetical protein HETIRDRAFT_106703 [Heterobasidion irregulare TC 32-1]|uniref:Uncharacterized protein n=1 Tax=Heterobasidion irregulare (strain TC 32-1) TaxID=747525 RepID=W4JTU1_HETIT|nr:uncharacterized protein HETIRDRAFT_106703 [Heterobasidion irregulare TC 32-1]ETW76276.1 hypothetical protein HETIRDRAFT_106703 [Heterobasidion irregulare TC 32-1]
MVVKALTTKMGVTGCGQYLEDALIDGWEADIKSTTTEILDNDLRLATFLVKAWIDENSMSVTMEELKEKLTKVQAVVNPITSKMYESVGTRLSYKPGLDDEQEPFHLYDKL